MENKINIAEILKDCPKGMELDSPNYNGVVKFEGVTQSDWYPIKISITHNNMIFNNTLTKYGQTYKSQYHKCVIFPKGKTTWDGFQRPFKDGDVVVSKSGCWIGIVKSYNDCDETYNVYVAFENWAGNYINIFVDIKLEMYRLATEEEKEKFFKAIEDNGYKWDNKTKTLYKSEFNDGDVCTGKVRDNLVIFIYKKRINTTLIKSHFTLYVHVGFCKNCCIALKDEEIKFATEEEKQELFKAIQDNGYRWDADTKTLRVVGKLGKLKFKVGDVVQDKEGNKVKITEVVHECGCYLYKTEITNEIGKIYFDEDNDWKLVPNKFDITTLKPFDKVLVRDEDGQKWMCDIFSYYDDTNPRYPFWGVGRSNSKQCIPYEENKHLLGTTNDCDEFYKNW